MMELNTGFCKQDEAAGRRWLYWLEHVIGWRGSTLHWLAGQALSALPGRKWDVYQAAGVAAFDEAESVRGCTCGRACWHEMAQQIATAEYGLDEWNADLDSARTAAGWMVVTVYDLDGNTEVVLAPPADEALGWRCTCRPEAQPVPCCHMAAVQWDRRRQARRAAAAAASEIVRLWQRAHARLWAGLSAASWIARPVNRAAVAIAGQPFKRASLRCVPAGLVTRRVEGGLLTNAAALCLSCGTSMTTPSPAGVAASANRNTTAAPGLVSFSGRV